MMDDGPIGSMKQNDEDIAKTYIRNGIVNILTGLKVYKGLDIEDENFKETPERVATMIMNEKCVGINSVDKCKQILSKSFQKTKKEKVDQMIIVANPSITYSLCPHHLENVEYKVWMGYMPKDRVVGLSKFDRVIKLYSKQPILQEDFTTGLCDIVCDAINPLGTIVIVKGRHDCMLSRGTETYEKNQVVTSSLRGCFLEDMTFKEEFMSLCSFE